MARRKRIKKSNEAEVELTPMIDVVFQLLIFFIVTMEPIDVIGHLDVFRPAPDPNAKPEEQVEDMLRITVLREGLLLNQRRTGLQTLEKNLQRAAAVSKKQTILIQCSESSRHSSLVAVLDVCARVGLTELSVATLPTARKK